MKASGEAGRLFCAGGRRCVAHLSRKYKNPAKVGHPQKG
jgi:hypothetical protein